MKARAAPADWLVFAALAAAALAPAVSAGNSDFTYSDASRHAMDGVFVLDAVRELPLAHPVEWVERYYLTSPALGMGRYPPLFALVQAPFYAVLGVVPFAGRLASAIVFLVGLLFFYEATRFALGRPGAAFAALALASGPASVRWGREVMLELPATALLLGAALLYTRYLENRSARRLTAAIIVAALAGWVKQPAALGLAVIIGHLLLSARPEKPLRLLWPGLLAAAVILAPLAAMSLRFGRANLALLGDTARTYPFWSLENWACYIRQIPYYYLGWPVTILAAAGVALTVLKRGPDGASFWALWIVVFFAFFSLIGYKSSRLVMFWTPGLAFLAGAAVKWALFGRSKTVMAVAALLLVAALGATYAAGWGRAPRARGELRAAAARAVAAAPERILYLGGHGGTFVFRVREVAGVQRPTVVLGSKVLFADVVQKEIGRVEKVTTTGEVKDVVARVAPDVAVVERGRGVEDDLPNAGRLFLDYTRTGAFDLLDAVDAEPWTGQAPPFSVEVYFYRGPRTPGKVEIPMPGVGMALELRAGDR